MVVILFPKYNSLPSVTSLKNLNDMLLLDIYIYIYIVFNLNHDIDPIQMENAFPLTQLFAT